MRFSTIWMFVLVVITSACDAFTLKLADADGDGYDATVDCNDSDPKIHPGADELCDSIDNDCDGIPDNRELDHCLDYDGDGFGDPAMCGYSICAVARAEEGLYTDNGGDCDDFNNEIHPDAPELCDGIDNNCDGRVDPDTSEDALTQYHDADQDGFGDPTTSLVSCDVVVGYVSDDGDCDDTDSLIHPDAEEADGVEGIEGLDSCDDDVDNNCDGLVDSRAPECIAYEEMEGDTGDTASPE